MELQDDDDPHVEGPVGVREQFAWMLTTYTAEGTCRDRVANLGCLDSARVRFDNTRRGVEEAQVNP